VGKYRTYGDLGPELEDVDEAVEAVGD